MFNRKLFKTNAKAMLKRYYWKAVLILALLTGVPFILSMLTAEVNIFLLFKAIGQSLAAIASGSSAAMESASAAINQANRPILPDDLYSVMVPVYSAFSLLVAVVLPISYSRFFLRARENPANIGEILYPFNKNYGTNLGVMYASQLIISLWIAIPAIILGIVFGITAVIFAHSGTPDSPWVMIIIMYAAIFAAMIPGIVKSYQYFMLPYILAENPKMNFKRAFQLTKDMTKGYKWKLFVLRLSFLGWELLAVLVPFGLLFLSPYIYAAQAEAYTFLKARVLEKGLASPEDFPGLRDVTVVQAAAATEAMQTAEALPEESAAAPEPAAENTEAETEATRIAEPAAQAEETAEAESITVTADEAEDNAETAEATPDE